MNIVHFTDFEKNKIELVGGKGYHLINLHSKQFNVPRGFVVSTKAYFNFLEHNDIKDKVYNLISRIDVENHKEVENASKKIRNLIVKGESKMLQKEIQNALKSLEGDKFAVRSSSQAEDLETASFAGQHDTFLNVGENDVIRHIQLCWASLFSPRAIFYREQQGIKHYVGIAVVIQEMVDAEFAGVMFTKDPINKRDILIEVVPGLGEKLVSGRVTPNTYFLGRKDFKIVQKNTTERFNEALLEDIAKLGLKIESHYGNPQDIEFAIKNKKIFVLQSRPITA